MNESPFNMYIRSLQSQQLQNAPATQQALIENYNPNPTPNVTASTTTGAPAPFSNDQLLATLDPTQQGAVGNVAANRINSTYDSQKRAILSQYPNGTPPSAISAINELERNRANALASTQLSADVSNAAARRQMLLGLNQTAESNRRFDLTRQDQLNARNQAMASQSADKMNAMFKRAYSGGIGGQNNGGYKDLSGRETGGSSMVFSPTNRSKSATPYWEKNTSTATNRPTPTGSFNNFSRSTQLGSNAYDPNSSFNMNPSGETNVADNNFGSGSNYDFFTNNNSSDENNKLYANNVGF